MKTIIKVEVRPYLHSELVRLFNTSKSSFNRLLKPHRAKLGKRIGNRWSIKQVEMIFEILDIPYIIVEE